jgi:RNA polymerase sigma-70 factor (ECF subfamily)
VVLTLHDIEGYSLPELANIFEVPTGTMKSRLHRARAHLRGLLAAESNVTAIRFKKPG